MEQDYNLKKWSKGCPNTGINCRRSSCGIEYVFIPAALGDDQEGSPVAPKNGSYNNAIVYYEATGNVYLYSSDGVPTRVEKNLDSIIAELQRELNDVEEALSEETSAREAADAAIEQEIEDLRNEPDVVDIVGTYADLQAYNTSDLGDKDIIRVLVDETHDDESTYYRWNKTPQTWTYVGAIDGYYTKDQTDTLLSGKQNVLTAGDNISITNDTISAVDTTYTAGTGLALNGTQFSVDTTAIATQTDLTAGLATKQGTLTAGANVQINNNTISATDTTYTAGTGISINNNVISASGGETMLVTISQTTIGQYSDIWVWSSDYTFAQLTANPDAIRVFVDDWCYESEGNIKPTDAKVGTFGQSTEIYLVRDLAGVEMRFALQQPQELEGQTVNPAIFNVTNFVDENKTLLTILPTLTLADNATYIPDGTTITLRTLSSDKEMYGEIGSSDCYPHREIITGNFMILPVRRKVGSGASYWAEEECLVTSVSIRGTSNVADRYIYKTFAFNGEHYKMTLTSDSYPNVVYTITKIPGGQTYTAGTGIDITNGVISCTFANGNGVSY